MKIKRVLTFVFALALTGMAWAQSEGYRKVWVALADGTNAQIALSSTLETTFGGDRVLFADGETQFAFRKDQVLSFRFDTEPLSAVASVPGDDTFPFVGKGVIRFNNLPADSRVTLTDLNGKSYFSTLASGECTLALPDLPQGVYIVSVNTMSYKVIVK